MPDGVRVSPRETAYTPAPGTSVRCRGLPYTQGMEWDPDKVQVDTLLPDDPRLHIGTITADRIVAGEFDWDKFDLVMHPLKGGSS